MQYSGQDLLWLIGSLSRIFCIPFNSNQTLGLEEGDCVMQKLNAKLTPLVPTEQAILNGNNNADLATQGDWLAGGTGNDLLVGSDARDVLTGGDGQDLLIGGAGDDDILGDRDWVAQQFDWTVTNLADGTRYFQPISQYTTTGTGQAQSDVIYAGNGNDHVWAGQGNDVVFGESGSDIINGEDGNDIILGGTGNDVLSGDASYIDPALHGDDYIDGGLGADILMGDGGNDILIGGKDVDILNGGAGQDTYIYNLGDGIDTIIDNRADRNILRFGAGIDKNNIKLNLGSLMLDLGNGDQIHINNTDQITANGFDRNDVFNSSSITSFEFADGSTLSMEELLARGGDLQGTSGNDEAAYAWRDAA